MSHLADTSVLVEYLRGSQPARLLIREAAVRGEVVYGSVLTRIELLIGVRSGEEKATGSLIAALEWLPVDERIAEDADQLARQYARNHSGIDAVDYCIASTARLRDLEPWTLNVRHFPMFPGLKAPW